MSSTGRNMEEELGRLRAALMRIQTIASLPDAPRPSKHLDKITGLAAVALNKDLEGRIRTHAEKVADIVMGGRIYK